MRRDVELRRRAAVLVVADAPAVHPDVERRVHAAEVQQHAPARSTPAARSNTRAVRADGVVVARRPRVPRRRTRTDSASCCRSACRTPGSSQLPGTRMSGHAVSSNQRRSNPAGLAAGLAAYWNFQTPFSDWNHGDVSPRARAHSSAVGYAHHRRVRGLACRCAAPPDRPTPRATRASTAPPENVVEKYGASGLPGSPRSASTTVSALPGRRRARCACDRRRRSRASRGPRRASRSSRATRSLRSISGTPAASATCPRPRHVVVGRA